MASIVTQAIVLRRVDYREHDRMLTLFSPVHGKMEAVSRGCKRMNSPLLSCSECFAFGEYSLYSAKGRLTVVSCQLTENFYNLRNDFERLQYASALMNLTENTVQMGEAAPELFTLLLRTLTRLCYTERDAQAVSAAFLLHFLAVNGYSPSLNRCVRCGRELDESEIRLIDLVNGGAACVQCVKSMQGCLPIGQNEVRWMKDVLRRGIDKTDCPDSDAPGFLLARYAQERLGLNVKLTDLFT